MAREKNTYAKHQRESLKRQKAQAKQERREKRKSMPALSGDAETPVEPSDQSEPLA